MLRVACSNYHSRQGDVAILCALTGGEVFSLISYKFASLMTISFTIATDVQDVADRAATCG